MRRRAMPSVRAAAGAAAATCETENKGGANRTSFQEGNGLSPIGDAPVRFGRSVGTRIAFTGR